MPIVSDLLPGGRHRGGSSLLPSSEGLPPIARLAVARVPDPGCLSPVVPTLRYSSSSLPAPKWLLLVCCAYRAQFLSRARTLIVRLLLSGPSGLPHAFTTIRLSSASRRGSRTRARCLPPPGPHAVHLQPTPTAKCFSGPGTWTSPSATASYRTPGIGGSPRPSPFPLRQPPPVQRSRLLPHSLLNFVFRARARGSTPTGGPPVRLPLSPSHLSSSSRAFPHLVAAVGRQGPSSEDISAVEL